MVDLIYTDVTKKDLGILNEYEFDCAFGSDENSFELITPRNSSLLEVGSLIYVENSEIGGIIDIVGVDTANKQTIYKGRTWHGILNEKILEPLEGDDYLLLSGEANEVLGDIISQIDLDDLFESSSDVSDFDIDNYLIRYGSPVFEINRMLWNVTAKLKLYYDGVKQKVILSAVPYIDYSLDEEWSASNKDFDAEKNYLPVNHLICLGQGNLADRYVIHLFTDEAGNVQDYTTEENPVCDEDYILDKSQQDSDLTGPFERVAIFNSENSQTTDNYILTDTKPGDYESHLDKYYKYDDENDKYEQLEIEKIERYQLLKQKPSDWDTNLTDYYKLNGTRFERASLTAYSLLTEEPFNWQATYTTYFEYVDGEYKNIDANTSTSYRSISAKKAKKSFKNGQYKKLYTKYWDGTQWIYESVSDVSYDTYKLQSKKPSDWTNNFNHYYQKKKKAKGYETVKGVKHKKNGHVNTTAPTWKKKKYYTKYTKQKKPKYNKNKTYYQEITKSSIPTWTTNKYYEAIPNYTIPTWRQNEYYMKVTDEYIPPWDIQDVYELKQDHYAVLVEDGIKHLQELQNCDNININLRQDISYDIGDVVGVTDEITGLQIWQPISKKIIKISRHKKTIQYEIGGKIYGDGSSYR